jgi:predicted DNA-binding protein (MmcQ/YjbR family)
VNIEDLREYCLSFKATSEGFPFDEKVLVFKAGGKIFALCDIDSYDFVNLKCDPDWALELRAEHPGITPGWHMSKTHWNSVLVDGSIDRKLLKELIKHSYELIVKSLTKKARLEHDL